MRGYTLLLVVQLFCPSDLFEYFDRFSLLLVNYWSSFGLLVPCSLPLFLPFQRNSLLSPSIPHKGSHVGIYPISSTAKIDAKNSLGFFAMLLSSLCVPVMPWMSALCG